MGPGSFRYAVDCAADGDTIYFSPMIAGDTILLTDSILIDKDVFIVNTNASVVTIDGESTLRMMRIVPGKSVTMMNLQLFSGTGATGRAITNDGNLILNDVLIIDNGSNPSVGNALVNHGLLTLRNDCRIEIN